jgi:hypothetical protein
MAETAAESSPPAATERNTAARPEKPGDAQPRRPLPWRRGLALASALAVVAWAAAVLQPPPSRDRRRRGSVASAAAAPGIAAPGTAAPGTTAAAAPRARDGAGATGPASAGAHGAAAPSPVPGQTSSAAPARRARRQSGARAPVRGGPGQGSRAATADRAGSVPPALATVQVSASPWATVTVPGQATGCAETPCTLRLPAGTHLLQLHNPVAGLGKEVRLVLEAGETRLVREVLLPR